MQVTCREAGLLTDTVEVESEPLPAELEWGQVLLSMKYALVDAADAYTSLMAGTFSDVTVALPYTAGHHGVASVMKVGALWATADRSISARSTIMGTEFGSSSGYCSSLA